MARAFTAKPKPKTKADFGPAHPKIWVLTCEHNDYDQHGEYFVAVFASLPSLQKLAEFFDKHSISLGIGSRGVMEAVAFLEHLRAGGGRQKTEDTWYNLKEVDLL